MNIEAFHRDIEMHGMRTIQAARFLRRLAMLVLLSVVWLSWPSSVQAQSRNCWLTMPEIAFGEVGGGGAATSGTLTFTCNNDIPISYRLCLVVDPSNPPGVAPRRMIRYGPETFLRYDLYADPALSQLIGSAGQSYGTYSTVLTVAKGGPATGSMQLYAKIHPGQTVASGDYVSQNFAILHYASRDGVTPPSPEECVASGSSASNYFTVTAKFKNTCYVSTATDMEFGTVANLATSRDQTSQVSLLCPVNTAWHLALDYGNNAVSTTRRMRGPGGKYITYELYKTAARTEVWGNTSTTGISGVGTNASQVQTVYGRVPAQPVGSPGTYSDTIRITLTY